MATTGTITVGIIAVTAVRAAAVGAKVGRPEVLSSGASSTAKNASRNWSST
jgi:hypothetical protein